ncbi:MAG: thioredoxin family protein [Candidatus Thorarchaeota archaeon]
MAEIPKEMAETVVKRFKEELKNSVRLVFFTQELECQFCAITHQLLETVSKLSDKISFEVYDFQKDKEKAKELEIDKIPALAILGEKDYGFRFYGIPSGYEFQTLVEGIIFASTAESQLPPKAIEALAKAATKPINIQVFVIPTCPICPVVGTMALQFAVANTNVSANIVEIAEFPHLANKYNVIGTPKTTINEKTQFEGLVPPAQFINFIQQAAQGSPTGISPTI